MTWRQVVGRLLVIGALFVVGFSLVWYGSQGVRAALVPAPAPLPPALTGDSVAGGDSLAEGDSALEHAPVVVQPERRLPPATVRPSRHPVFDFDFGLDKPLIARRRLPVQITMYCLSGTTAAGNPVRPGIIAADPRVLPLGTVVDVYVGLRYHGRFLVDDTGRVIKGAIIDIWTQDCRDARRFGRRRGAVVLVEAAPRRGSRRR